MFSVLSRSGSVGCLVEAPLGQQLAESIAAFDHEQQAVGYYDGTLVSLDYCRSARASWGACDGASRAFADFLISRNVSARYVGSGLFVTDSLFNDKTLPYQPHLYGEEHHAYVEVHDQQGQVAFAVDWTAAQFGYEEFPLVWARQDDGSYQTTSVGAIAQAML